MRLLDLFCKAGGAAKGYADAGFEVFGVDIEPQPNYPYDFDQADAMEVLMRYENGLHPYGRFDVIHASPPCQSYSVTSSLHSADYPELVDDVRWHMENLGAPYVIENVVGAPLVDAFRLCGSSFGLGVRRHRLFETSPILIGAPQCAHHLQPEPIDVTGTGGPGGRHRKPANLAHAREVMGIDWMTRPELSEAIPPAYTEWIGRQLLAHLEVAA